MSLKTEVYTDKQKYDHKYLTGKSSRVSLFSACAGHAINTIVSILLGHLSSCKLVFVRNAPAIPSMTFPPLEKITRGYKDYKS